MVFTFPIVQDKFQRGFRDEKRQKILVTSSNAKFEKQRKWWRNTKISLANFKAVSVQLNGMLLIWKIQQTMRDDAIRTARIHSSNRAEVFIWQNFQPAYRDPSRQNRDLGNQARPPSHMKTSKFFTKDLKVSRDLGNRASPVKGSCEETLRQEKITSATQGCSVAKTWFHVVSHIKPTVFYWFSSVDVAGGNAPGTRLAETFAYYAKYPARCRCLLFASLHAKNKWKRQCLQVGYMPADQFSSQNIGWLIAFALDMACCK